MVSGWGGARHSWVLRLKGWYSREQTILGREDLRPEDNRLTGLYAGSVQKLRGPASGDSQEFGLVYICGQLSSVCLLRVEF